VTKELLLGKVSKIIKSLLIFHWILNGCSLKIYLMF